MSREYVHALRLVPVQGHRAAGGRSWRSLRWVSLLVVSVMLVGMPVAAQSPAAGEPQRFSISQARQTGSEPVSIRGYLDIQSGGGEAVRDLGAARISATIGSFPAQVRPPRWFGEVNEGVGYIFLVDVSKSLRREQFQEMRAAIDRWVSSLQPNDRVALISFGSSSQVEVDWTERFTQIRTSLNELGPTDDFTLLNQALADALELGQRKDASLPGRRAIVVLSDGRDEGSGLALEDVLARVRNEPSPIYTIGFVPAGRANRERDLDVLRRLASNSGGSFFEASAATLTESYSRIRAAIQNVWVVDLVCPRCAADGDQYRIQIDVSVADRVLSNGSQMRLLPGVQTPVAATSSPGRQGGAPTAVPGAAGSGAATAGNPGAGPATAGNTASATPAETQRAPQRSRAMPRESWFFARRNLFFFWLPLLVGLALLIAGLLRSRTSSSEAPSVSVRDGRRRPESRQSPGWALGADELYEREGDQPQRGVGADGDGAPPEPGSSSFSLSLPSPEEYESALRKGSPFDSKTNPPTPSEIGSDEDPESAPNFLAPTPASESGQLSTPSPLPSLRGEAASAPLVEDAPVGRSMYATAPRVVRLVVLRGRSKGKQHRVLLRDQLVVGARSTADLVLAGESNVASEQFELTQEKGDVYIANLAEDKPTLVNGHELEGKQILRAGDLVGNGDIILRVVLGD